MMVGTLVGVGAVVGLSQIGPARKASRATASFGQWTQSLKNGPSLGSGSASSDALAINAWSPRSAVAILGTRRPRR